MAEGHIERVLKERNNPEKEKSPSEAERPTLFQHLAHSDLPESDLTKERLSIEAQVILGAGTVTSARTLDFISYYIVTNDHIRERLVEELRDVMAGYPEKPPAWAQLEKLPYLQAVIKEGLRYITPSCDVSRCCRSLTSFKAQLWSHTSLASSLSYDAYPV